MAETPDDKQAAVTKQNDPDSKFAGCKHICALACWVMHVICWPFRIVKRHHHEVLAIGTVFTAAVIFLQYCTLEKTDQTLRVSNRAFVHVTNPRSIDIIREDDGLYWRVSPEWKNTGKTATFNLTIESYCPGRDNAKDDPWESDKLVDRHNRFVLGSDQVTPGITCKIPVQLAIDAQERRRHLFLTSRAQYFDKFGGDEPYVTEFCMEIVEITGNLNNPDSRIGFNGIPCPRHNCADKECKQ